MIAMLKAGLGVFALMLGLGAAVEGASPEMTITVAVTSPYDKPVANAEVILDFLGSHQITKLGKRRVTHWEVRSNQEGKAQFPPIPQGTIQVQVVAKDYQTFGKRFDVDATEKTVDVKLERPQSQYSAHPPLKPADSK